MNIYENKLKNKSDCDSDTNSFNDVTVNALEELASI